MGPHSSEQGNEGDLSGKPYIQMLQWGLTLPSKETNRRVVQTTLITPASMGPHSSEQGNQVGIFSRLNREIGFNGASLFRARKQANSSMNWQRQQQLQWGLTLPSKETCSRTTCHSRLIVLQWGLTLPSKETFSASTQSTFSPRFNGASLFRARKL